MKHRLRHILLSLLGLPVLTGCPTPPTAPPPPQPQVEPPSGQVSLLQLIRPVELPPGQLPPSTELPPAAPRPREPVAMAQNPQPSAYNPLDPVPSPRVLYVMEVYRLTVPMRSFSSNEEFWRRVDEQVVDVATYDVLYKNGIRLGQAPLRELEHFRKFIEETTPTQKLSVTGVEAERIEIEMKKDLEQQMIFHLDGMNALAGRSYDKCSNLMNLQFEAAPRQRDRVRVGLCPMVRAHRRRLEFAAISYPEAERDKAEREIQYISPEQFYDLNLKVDLPLDCFMIVAPSEHATRPTSVGNAFLMKDGPTERLEQILLIIPRVAS